MKKLLSIILACVMLLVMAPAGAAVADDAVAVAVDTSVAAPGDTDVEVYVRMGAEPHWAGVDMEFQFDAAKLTYKGFRRNPAIEAQAAAGDTIVCVINTDSAGEGVVGVHFAVAGNAGGYFGYFPDGYDWFGVLVFDVAPSAAEGLAPVSASISSLTDFDSEAVPFTLSAGGVNVTACEHEWTVTAHADMDCENDGFTDRVCSKCGAVRHEVIPARGHHWNEIARVEPTAEAEGSVTYECVWCGATRTEILEVLPPFDGVRIRVEKVAADPGAEFLEVKIYVDDTPRWGSLSMLISFDENVLTFEDFTANKALSRQMSTGKPVIFTLNDENAEGGRLGIYLASAMISDGYEGYHSGGYDYLGVMEFDVADNAPAGLSEISVEVTKLTDKESNNVQFETVSGGVKVNCIHDWIESGREEHCTEDGHVIYICSKCLEYKREEIGPVGHNWGEWEVTSPETCEAAAVETRVCSRCGESETREGAAALGHEWGDWETATAATCAAAGSEKRTCSRCSEVETREIPIDPEAHDWGEWEVTSPATCEAAAVETRVCANDPSHTETREGAAALGHVWGEWTVTRGQTFYRVGEETRVCANDPSHIETREIPRYLKGDMDFDGEVTVADALIVLRIAAQLAEETELSIAVADVDRDDEITVADALQVLRRAVNLISAEDWERAE